MPTTPPPLDLKDHTVLIDSITTCLPQLTDELAPEKKMVLEILKVNPKIASLYGTEEIATLLEDIEETKNHYTDMFDLESIANDLTMSGGPDDEPDPPTINQLVNLVIAVLTSKSKDTLSIEKIKEHWKTQGYRYNDEELSDAVIEKMLKAKVGAGTPQHNAHPAASMQASNWPMRRPHDGDSSSFAFTFFDRPPEEEAEVALLEALTAVANKPFTERSGETPDDLSLIVRRKLNNPIILQRLTAQAAEILQQQNPILSKEDRRNIQNSAAIIDIAEKWAAEYRTHGPDANAIENAIKHHLKEFDIELSKCDTDFLVSMLKSAKQKIMEDAQNLLLTPHPSALRGHSALFRPVNPQRPPRTRTPTEEDFLEFLRGMTFG